MTALSSALDSMYNMQIGENGTLEYGWSEDIQELITQFQYQLVRTPNMKKLEEKYQEVLMHIFTPLLDGTDSNLEYLRTIYKLIGYTRDIVAGKGEYQLSYMLISGLYKFSQKPEAVQYKYRIIAMATSALESLVRLTNQDHPYGSWKDLKYFCNYHIDLANRDEDSLKKLNDPLFNKVLDLFCGQLKCDENAPVKTLAARWVPREKSAKFGWLTVPLAKHYYKNWISDELTPSQYSAAKRKCLTHFRKTIAKINRELKTPQINQCSGTWSEIDFDKNVTSITLRKQSKAFHGVTKGNYGLRQVVQDNQDRLTCRCNYIDYVSRCSRGETKAKGKRVSLVDFVRDALSIYNENNVVERELLNSQWKNNGEQNSELGNVLAMVDTSGSMEDQNYVPLYSAIGLGLRVAENSKLGKRVLTFSSHPEWINLDNCVDFVDMVNKTRGANWGMNTNFQAAFDMILNMAISKNISPYEMEDLVLLILSDMQIDRAGNANVSMFEMMKQKYADAGMRTRYEVPYKLPHIVFWNLRSTEGFPSISRTENTTMISGNSPVLLNTFSKKGMIALKEMTPWSMFTEQLNNDRYNYLDTIITNLWTI